MIGFIDTSYTQPETTGNYSAVAISTLYSSLLHPLVSSVFTSPGNGFVIVSLSLQITYEAFFAQPYSFLDITLPTANSGTRLNSNSSCVRSSLYSLRVDSQKTPFPLLLRSNEQGADKQRMPHATPLLLLHDVTAYVTCSSAACVRAITWQRLFLYLHRSCFKQIHHNMNCINN
jgi:hypothetical protein